MNPGRLGPIANDLGRRLRDPLQIRIVVAATLVLGWYFAAYPVLSGGIDEAGRAADRSRAHAGLALEVEALRVEAARYRGRLGPGGDPNELVAYVLRGIRERKGVRIAGIAPMPPSATGSLGLATVSVELKGDYAELDALLEWVESNPRLLRVDSAGIGGPASREPGAILRLVILGLTR